MKVLIIGNKGNMGQRYTAILKHLGHEVLGQDLGEEFDDTQVDAIIIATPTSTHLDLISRLIFTSKPVLCEKPFVSGFDLSRLFSVLNDAKKTMMKLTMVSQYDYLPDGENGETSYNFYRSGGDSLAFDCINIIKRARGKIKLRRNSPIWKCKLNGKPQSIRMMDHAYIAMLKDWLEKPYEPQYDLILNAHQKVLDYLDGQHN